MVTTFYLQIDPETRACNITVRSSRTTGFNTVLQQTVYHVLVSGTEPEQETTTDVSSYTAESIDIAETREVVIESDFSVEASEEESKFLMSL